MPKITKVQIDSVKVTVTSELTGDEAERAGLIELQDPAEADLTQLQPLHARLAIEDQTANGRVD